ncbi:DNA-binding transcriptional LysR family regulator [Pseudochelatococcus lubricantis]|uniref:DNA-binding transcriptional LysR family regulator n=1 Tax=Pseudochelatococcus lubricantis TaxID=1538102 RepID=A0ABX0V511_9HYPH|nr:LysR family transcriptional regulator [Pseudochelatococcus lubricantis]NIJ58855.1 DNA-binding transcriptional LysR family regulator [Pseudochelatococcus lubricantis]
MSSRPATAELNWNLLRIFCVIAEESGITRAAKRLQMSQPSVSLALQKLEEQLGCQLVFRGSRHFALTLRGERIYQECAEILRGVDRISLLAEDRNDEEFGELRLSIISGLHSPLFDEALRLYHHRYPSIVWRIDVRNSLETVRQITQDKAGIGICLLTKPMINLECRHLFREEFGVFCGAEHRLFGREQVDTRELAQEPFVTFSCASEGMGLEPMIMLRDGLGLGRRISGSSHNLQEIRRMIIAGLGIGILPVVAVADEVEAGHLWPLRLADHSLGADVFLVYSGPDQLTVPERNFVVLLDELLKLYPDMT